MVNKIKVGQYIYICVCTYRERDRRSVKRHRRGICIYINTYGEGEEGAGGDFI